MALLEWKFVDKVEGCCTLTIICLFSKSLAAVDATRTIDTS